MTSLNPQKFYNFYKKLKKNHKLFITHQIQKMYGFILL